MLQENSRQSEKHFTMQARESEELIPCRLYEKCNFKITPFRQKIYVYFVGNSCEFVDKSV